MTNPHAFFITLKLTVVIPTIGGIFFEEQDTFALKEDFSLRCEMTKRQFYIDKNSIPIVIPTKGRDFHQLSLN